MFKKLTRQGNSTALILDRQIMELLGIDRDAVVKVSVRGRRLIVEPLSEEERAMKIKEIQRKTLEKNAELFKRLAK
jgi:antitoxin MazE